MLCREAARHHHMLLQLPGPLSTMVPLYAARYHEKLMLAAQHSVALVAAFARHSDLAQQPSAQSTFNLGASTARSLIAANISRRWSMPARWLIALAPRQMIRRRGQRRHGKGVTRFDWSDTQGQVETARLLRQSMTLLWLRLYVVEALGAPCSGD